MMAKAAEFIGRSTVRRDALPANGASHLIVAAAWVGALLAGVPGMAGVQLAQASVVIRRTTIVRVPVPAAPVSRPQRWTTRRGPRCIELGRVAGAAITQPDSVDMIFRGGRRIRAELEDACPALDFYSGFYLRPSADGRVCARRDTVHARSGGQCGIERFRLLVPARK